MIGNVIDILTGLMLLIGALLALVASIGLLRLPDLLTRMHAASKAGVAGSGLALLAVALHSQDIAIWLKCLVTLAFFLLTAPVAAHLLAKAASKASLPLKHLDDENRR